MLPSPHWSLFYPKEAGAPVERGIGRTPHTPSMPRNTLPWSPLGITEKGPSGVGPQPTCVPWPRALNRAGGSHQALVQGPQWVASRLQEHGHPAASGTAVSLVGRAPAVPLGSLLVTALTQSNISIKSRFHGRGDRAETGSPPDPGGAVQGGKAMRGSCQMQDGVRQARGCPRDGDGPERWATGRGCPRE